MYAATLCDAGKCSKTKAVTASYRACSARVMGSVSSCLNLGPYFKRSAAPTDNNLGGAIGDDFNVIACATCHFILYPLPRQSCLPPILGVADLVTFSFIAPDSMGFAATPRAARDCVFEQVQLNLFWFSLQLPYHCCSTMHKLFYTPWVQKVYYAHSNTISLVFDPPGRKPPVQAVAK